MRNDIGILKDHFIFKLPYFKRFSAMTISPNIYINSSVINPESVPKTLIDHEMVHIFQQDNECCFLMYLTKYIAKWFKNLFTYGFSMKAYYAIDWEVEAYSIANPGVLGMLGLGHLEEEYNEKQSEK